jgi:TolB-like protein
VSKKRRITYLFSSIVIILFLGCSTSFKNPVYSTLTQEKEGVNIKRVGVLPFINESGRRGAGEIVANTFITMIFKSGIFSVEEKGNIERFLLNEKVKNINAMDTEQLKKLGERLRVDALFIGVVEEFSGSDKSDRSIIPVVGIRVRLIDVKTGRILWMVRHKRNGDDYISVFSFGKIRSVSTLTKKVISEVIETIK